MSVPDPYAAALLADALPASFYEAAFLVGFLLALLLAAVLGGD